MMQNIFTVLLLLNIYAATNNLIAIDHIETDKQNVSSCSFLHLPNDIKQYILSIRNHQGISLLSDQDLLSVESSCRAFNSSLTAAAWKNKIIELRPNYFANYSHDPFIDHVKSYKHAYYLLKIVSDENNIYVIFPIHKEDNDKQESVKLNITPRIENLIQQAFDDSKSHYLLGLINEAKGEEGYALAVHYYQSSCSLKYKPGLKRFFKIFRKDQLNFSRYISDDFNEDFFINLALSIDENDKIYQPFRKQAFKKYTNYKINFYSKNGLTFEDFENLLDQFKNGKKYLEYIIANCINLNRVIGKVFNSQEKIDFYVLIKSIDKITGKQLKYDYEINGIKNPKNLTAIERFNKLYTVAVDGNKTAFRILLAFLDSELSDNENLTEDLSDLYIKSLKILKSNSFLKQLHETSKTKFQYLSPLQYEEKLNSHFSTELILDELMYRKKLIYENFIDEQVYNVLEIEAKAGNRLAYNYSVKQLRKLSLDREKILKKLQDDTKQGNMDAQYFLNEQQLTTGYNSYENLWNDLIYTVNRINIGQIDALWLLDQMREKAKIVREYPHEDQPSNLFIRNYSSFINLYYGINTNY